MIVYKRNVFHNKEINLNMKDFFIPLEPYSENWSNFYGLVHIKKYLIVDDNCSHIEIINDDHYFVTNGIYVYCEDGCGLNAVFKTYLSNTNPKRYDSYINVMGE